MATIHQRSVPSTRNRSSAGDPVTAVAAGVKHTCASTRDGSLWCWGDNSYGQLGIGALLNLNIPMSVSLPAGGTFAPLEKTQL